MNGADYLILAVLVVSMLLGFFRGFLRESISLIAWLGGTWLAWRFAYVLEPYLGGALAHHPAKIWVARSLILVAAVLAGWLLAALLGYLIRPGLSLVVDRLLGMFFGAIRGAVILSVLVILAQLVKLDDVDWWKESRMMPKLVDLASWVQAFADAGSDYLESPRGAATGA
ncbi:MAG: CvpA family protein [Steroidobacteraceae bacterium]